MLNNEEFIPDTILNDATRHWFRLRRWISWLKGIRGRVGIWVL